MKIGELSTDAFAERARRGVSFKMGPFTTRLTTAYRDLTDTVHYVYYDHSMDEGPFADFDVTIKPPAGLRRWIRKQALFVVDGTPMFEPYPGNLTMPLFEWGLNWCIAGLGHDYQIIHAAVLAHGDRALVMPAKPGAGKSTLCCALAHRGWRFLSDEFALLRPADGRVEPIPRPIGLKNESVDVIRRFAPEAQIGPLWRETQKGNVAHVRPPADAVARMDESAQPAWVVFPTWAAGTPARWEEHGKAEAVLRVADHSLNYPIMGEQGFDMLVRLADECACLEFEYGDLDEAIAAFDELAGADA